MNIYNLTYNITLSDTVELKFYYDYPTAAGPLDFTLQAHGISNLQIGYDTDREHFYPGNITITIIDYQRTNLRRLYNLKSAYNHSQPFNHWSVFYLEIYRNGVRKFRGVLDNIQDDWDAETLMLTFTDATNLFRSMSFRNPSVIFNLASYNFGRLQSSIDPFGYGKTFWYFGLSSLVFKADKTIEMFYSDDYQFVINYNLNDFLTRCLRIFNPDISFTVNVPYTFFRQTPQLSGTFANLYMAFEYQGGPYKPHPIYSLLGRFMLVKDDLPFNIPNINDWFEYCGEFSCLSGPEGHGTYKLWVLKMDDGVVSSFTDLFMKTANSFSSKFGFTDYDHAYLVEKNTYQTQINTARFLRDASREIDSEPVSHVETNYLFYPDDPLSESGERTADTSKSKSYEVIFDTYNPADGLDGFRGNLWLRVGSTSVFHYINNVVLGNFSDTHLSKLAAKMHLAASLGNFFKYDLSLQGFADFLKTYNISYYNELISLKPSEINYDIFQDVSFVTAHSKYS